ncbi:hypothetical protein AVEN_243534-1, partial [Araneus ventricosus]
VNPGSLSEQAGLMNGDAILKILGHPTENMRHKEAQDAILRAGNNIELVVQRLVIKRSWFGQLVIFLAELKYLTVSHDADSIRKKKWSVYVNFLLKLKLVKIQTLTMQTMGPEDVLEEIFLIMKISANMIRNRKRAEK